MSSKLIHKLAWREYNAKSHDGIIILPVGATEQHSTHLPLGVDSIITENVALMLAEEIDALVAPPLYYGYKSQPSSGGGPLFPGTIDLNGATLTCLAGDILKELLADGWQRVLVLNGHFENQAFLIEAADLLLREQKSDFPRVIITSWWDNISKDVLPKVFDEVEFAGWELEHAAIVETSVMMFFAPELVNQDLFLDEGLESVPRFHSFPVRPGLLPESGNLHTPRTSSAEKGKIIVEDVVRSLKKMTTEQFS